MNADHSRLQDMADQHLRDNRRAVEPDDDEVIDGFVECFGGTRAQAVARLAQIDFPTLCNSL